MGFLPIAGAAASLLGNLFGHKSQQKQADEQRRAQIAGLNIQNQQHEDTRLGKVGLGASILNGLQTPGAAYGGHITHNAPIDPEVLKGLQTRRSYDFASAVPNQNAGGTTGFIGSLLGGAGNLLGEMDLQHNKSGLGPLSGGSSAPESGQASVPGGVGGINLEDLLNLSKSKGAL